MLGLKLNHVSKRHPDVYHEYFRENWPCYVRTTFVLTHLCRDKMATILQKTLSNAFSWMKMSEFRLRFHWNFFLLAQFTIFQHRFRWWLGAVQATSHYLNQWLVSLLMHICIPRPQWVNPLTLCGSHLCFSWSNPHQPQQHTGAHYCRVMAYTLHITEDVCTQCMTPDMELYSDDQSINRQAMVTDFTMYWWFFIKAKWNQFA